MEIPRHWRLRKQRYSLQGTVCPNCDTKIFPPRDICPECHEDIRILGTAFLALSQTESSPPVRLPVALSR